MKRTLSGELNGPRDMMNRLACPFCREFGVWLRLVSMIGLMTPYQHTVGWRHGPCGATLRSKEWGLVTAEVHGYIARWWQPLVPSEDITDPAEPVTEDTLAFPS